MSGRGASRAVGCGALLLALAAYVPLADGYFLSDDFGWLWLIDRLRAAPLELLRVVLLDDAGHYVWGGELDHLLAFPLLSWWVDLSLWGADPRGHHATSLLLHLATAGLVWGLARRFLPAGAAVVALLAFLASPAQAEPVLWMAARGHIFATLFAAAAALPVAQERWVGALLALLGGLLSQEVAVGIPPLLALVEVAVRRAGWRTLAARHWPFWAALGLYFLYRRLIFGAAVPAWSHVALLDPRLPGRIIAELATPTSAPRLLRIVFVVMAGAAVAHLLRGRRSPVVLGLGWAFVALLPLLGPLTYGPRHFYLPSVGVALALGGLAQRGFAARVGVGVALAGALAVAVVWTSQLAQAGARSALVHTELMAALAADDSTPIVVLPEVPDQASVFWGRRPAVRGRAALRAAASTRPSRALGPELLLRHVVGDLRGAHRQARRGARTDRGDRVGRRHWPVRDAPSRRRGLPRRPVRGATPPALAPSGRGCLVQRNTPRVERDQVGGQGTMPRSRITPKIAAAMSRENASS